MSSKESDYDKYTTDSNASTAKRDMTKPFVKFCGSFHQPSDTTSVSRSVETKALSTHVQLDVQWEFYRRSLLKPTAQSQTYENASETRLTPDQRMCVGKDAQGRVIWRDWTGVHYEQALSPWGHTIHRKIPVCPEIVEEANPDQWRKGF